MQQVKTINKTTDPQLLCHSHNSVLWNDTTVASSATVNSNPTIFRCALHAPTRCAMIAYVTLLSFIIMVVISIPVLCVESLFAFRLLLVAS